MPGGSENFEGNAVMEEAAPEWEGAAAAAETGPSHAAGVDDAESEYHTGRKKRPRNAREKGLVLPEQKAGGHALLGWAGLPVGWAGLSRAGPGRAGLGALAAVKLAEKGSTHDSRVPQGWD